MIIDKNAINSWDAESKELYNKLTDHEKSEMKELCKLFGSLNEDMNTVMMVAQTTNHKGNVSLFIQEHLKGGKLSNRAKQRMSKTVLKVTSFGCDVLYRVRVVKNVTAYNKIVIKRVKTSSGYLYLTGDVTSLGTITIMAYTAHFFDRYAERNNLKMNREQTVAQFAQDELLRDRDNAVSINDRIDCEVKLLKGMALGKALCGDNIYMLFKTYITDEQIRENQINNNVKVFK